MWVELGTNAQRKGQRTWRVCFSRTRSLSIAACWLLYFTIVSLWKEIPLSTGRTFASLVASGSSLSTSLEKSFSALRVPSDMVDELTNFWDRESIEKSVESICLRVLWDMGEGSSSYAWCFSACHGRANTRQRGESSEKSCSAQRWTIWLDFAAWPKETQRIMTRCLTSRTE